MASRRGFDDGSALGFDSVFAREYRARVTSGRKRGVRGVDLGVQHASHRRLHGVASTRRSANDGIMRGDVGEHESTLRLPLIERLDGRRQSRHGHDARERVDGVVHHGRVSRYGARLCAHAVGVGCELHKLYTM